jgi:hypothetical protein
MEAFQLTCAVIKVGHNFRTLRRAADAPALQVTVGSLTHARLEVWAVLPVACHDARWARPRARWDFEPPAPSLGTRDASKG